MAGKTSTRKRPLHAAQLTRDRVLAASWLNGALQWVQLSTKSSFVDQLKFIAAERFALERDNHECVMEYWSIGVLDAS